MKPTIKDLLEYLSGQGAGGWQVQRHGYFYAETGRWKPWSVATIRAVERRGYKVVNKGCGVFYVYPKVELYSGIVEGL